MLKHHEEETSFYKKNNSEEFKGYFSQASCNCSSCLDVKTIEDAETVPWSQIVSLTLCE